MKEFYPILQSSILFRGIDAKDIAAMLSCLGARKQDFLRGASILESGASLESFGLLLSGSALIITEDYWGNRNIVSKLVPGDLFAEAFSALPDTPLSISVVCDANASVLFLNLHRLLTTCSNACVFHQRIIENLLRELAAKNQKLNEKITHISQRSTREKLLSYLSAQAARAKTNDFTIPFNRQELADYLSVDRSALSGELSKLRREGVLDFRKDHFTLKNPANDSIV